VVALTAFAGLALAQRLGSGKGIKFSDYYEPPHEKQMKWLLEGGSARPEAGGRIIPITEVKVQTWRENGEGEMVIEAPECVYDANQRSVSSPGLLHLRTADGAFGLEGQGFLWRQTNSTLFVSNRVHTVVHPGLVETPSANARTNGTARRIEAVNIFSDQFDYAEASGEGMYRGNVRVVGTNLALTAGTLTVQVPRSDRRLQSMTAESNVIVDYEGIHATGQQTTYAVDTEQVRLTGDPTWREGAREGRGDELVLDRTNGVFFANGHAWLKMPGHGMGALGFLPQGGSLATNLPPSTNQFIEVRSDAYEIRTNLAVFRENVRVTERRDDQLQAKLNCGLLTITFSGTNELQRIIAEKEVMAEQDTNRLTCGVLTLSFSGTNGLQRMIAENEVLIEQATNRFTAGKAVYTATNGMLRLTERPAWRAGQRSGTGDLIQVNAQRNEMKVQTNAYMRLPAGEFGRSAAFGFSAAPLTNSKAGVNQFAEILSHEYSVEPKGALFQGNVRVTSPQIQWNCGQINVLASPGAARVNRVVAEKAVVFDLTDDKGEKVHGAGDKAVYTFGVSGTVTNELMELSGSPAMLTTTNFAGQNEVFMLDLANHRLGAPGKSKYVVRNLTTEARSSALGLPDKPLKK
jgi:lipopolysaccharide transport protein LptA